MQTDGMADQACNFFKSITVKELKRNSGEIHPNGNHRELWFFLQRARGPFCNEHGLAINLPNALLKNSPSCIWTGNSEEKSVTLHFRNGDVAFMFAPHAIYYGVNSTTRRRVFIKLTKDE